MSEEIKQIIEAKLIEAAESNADRSADAAEVNRDNLMSIATLVKNLDHIGDAPTVAKLMSVMNAEAIRSTVELLSVDQAHAWIEALEVKK